MFLQALIINIFLTSQVLFASLKENVVTKENGATKEKTSKNNDVKPQTVVKSRSNSKDSKKVMSAVKKLINKKFTENKTKFNIFGKKDNLKLPKKWAV